MKNLNKYKIFRSLFILFLICALMLLSSCNKKKSQDKEKQVTGIHKTFERGPVSVSVDVDKKEITIADRLNLKITVTSTEDYEVELPIFGEKLQQFGIVDYHTSQPKLIDNNKKEISQSYILEPFLSGKYKIPAMKIIFKKKGEKNKHELKTENITISVISLLPEKISNLKIHDIAPPVNIPASYKTIIWVSIIIIILIIFIIILTILIKRKNAKKQYTETRISPHELAFKKLKQLIAEDLINKKEFKLFYQRISNILRLYIEKRFNLNAPEQTTIEFLESLKTSRELNKKYRSLLKDFLTYCDLVKFAEHQPEKDDIQKTFDSCKAFITGTKEEENLTIPAKVQLKNI